MKRTIYLISLVSALVLGVGCMHLHKVETSPETQEFAGTVKVSIGGKEVKEGEKLKVYKSKCKTVYGGHIGKRQECKHVKAGDAEVVKILDSEFALAKPLNGLVIDSNMTVEKEEPDEN